MESEKLYTCTITYHLVNGQTVSEVFEKDLPKELWAGVREDFSDELLDSFEIQSDERFSRILLPKSSVLYITMKVSG